MTTSQQDVQENQEIVSEWARAEKQDFDAMVSKYTDTDTSDAYWSSKKSESIALNQLAATTKNKQLQQEEMRQTGTRLPRGASPALQIQCQD